MTTPDKPSHTPGPWKIDPRADNHVISASRPICTIGFFNSADPQGTQAENAANARLIAQAWTIPALRAALEAVKPYLSKICCLEHEEAGLTEIVDAALALANEPADSPHEE